MHLSPREQDKLMIYVAAQLAADRKKRGLKLNHPEAVAYMTAAVLEGIRDGKSVAELMTYGTQILSRKDVMPGVPEMIPNFQVEGTFPDATKLARGIELFRLLLYAQAEQILVRFLERQPKLLIAHIA